MTLRVTFEVLPHGAACDKYPIHTVEVSQIGTHEGDLRDYEYRILEHNRLIPKGQAGSTLVVGMGKVIGHHRDMGALELMRRVLEEQVLFADGG